MKKFITVFFFTKSLKQYVSTCNNKLVNYADVHIRKEHEILLRKQDINVLMCNLLLKFQFLI